MPMRRGLQAARPAVPLEGWLPPGPSDVMALHAVLEKDPSGSLIIEVLDAMVADRLSDASLRLLPILHPLLVRREVNHPAVARIAGFYRQTRGRNLVLAHTAAEVMGALDERGQVGVCSRGLASAVGYYPDLGMRPTADINVTASAGVDLGELQRTLTTRGALQLTSKFISRRSLVLRDARGFNIAIRSVLDESIRVTLPDDVLLRDSVSVAVGADQLAVLNPEYLFCDVIHRGLRYRSPVSARWVADAVMAVRSAESFDWRRVQEYADLFGASATLQTGINWLAAEGFLPQRNLASHESGLDRKVQEIRVAPPSASIRRRTIDRSIVLPNRLARGDLRDAIRARAARLASVREAKPAHIVAASGGGGARPLDSWPPPQDERARLLTQLAQGRVDAEVLTRVADQVAGSDVDESLRRLLPALYPHYVSAGLEHPAVADIRGLYGLARALGARVRETAADAASILADAGSPCWFLRVCRSQRSTTKTSVRGLWPMPTSWSPKPSRSNRSEPCWRGHQGGSSRRARTFGQRRFVVQPICPSTSIASFLVTRPSLAQRTRFGLTLTSLCSVTALHQFVRFRRSTKCSTGSCTAFRGIQSHRTAGLSMWGRSSGSHQTSIGAK